MTTNPIADRRPPMTRHTTQILFLDHQPEIVAASRTNPLEALTAGSVALARLAQFLGIPIAVSCVPSPSGAPTLIESLEETLSAAPRFVRTVAPVFEDAATRAHLDAQNRCDLVVCGVVTEVAVLLAAFGAISNGYEVHVPVDACGGSSRRTEDAAFRRIESFGAATASVATLGAVLQPALAGTEGAAMMQILRTVMTG